MTGFGRGRAKSGATGTIITEIRSLNHRYLDLVIRTPREMQALEPRIKELIKGPICRGRVEVSIECKGERSISVKVNRGLAKDYLANLQRLGKSLSLKERPSLSFLCQMPGVIELCGSSISPEKAWTDIKKSIDMALKALLAMREREGKFIEKEIRDRLKAIKKRQEEIKKRTPFLLDKSSAPPFPGEKTDISEELSRFSSHLGQIGDFLNEKKEAGKKINFTVQEMLREVNTMAAKANDFAVSSAVIFIKSELEKIKEQIQNVE